ncbi:MAG: hypothetical protein H6657_00275 [Ardenticatenaceae bacterium]|nr:hypothetical protein [Ardenticatenaceae bacterium]
MKKIAAICILFLITACTFLPSSESTPEPDSESGISQASASELAWDHDPEALIIQAFADIGGSAPTAALINQLFAAQVWGDGRIIWVTWTDDFQRQVWQGQLSEAEMADLLETIDDKGFFRLKARYSPRENVMDGSTIGIKVYLLERSQEVSEYDSGAPDRFHELFDLLISGAGAEGVPYLPQSGQLTAREIEFDEWREQPERPIWDAAALGVDLHEAESLWLEGDALLRAWEVVNENPRFPIVEQDDSYFELHLRLPELGVMAPR